MLGIKTRALRWLAVRSPRHEGLYRYFCEPTGHEWADVLRERGDFYAMGEHCFIDPYAVLADRAFIRLGNNVRINKCTMWCHDGSVNMINRAYGLRLDNVGKIDIRDNVYIGFGAVILPGVTIGPNAIVAVGSVVRSDVAEGDVVGGVPAKRVGRLDMSVAILQAKNREFPWRHLIEARQGEGPDDSSVEPVMRRLRLQYFYGSPSEQGSHANVSNSGGASASKQPARDPSDYSTP
jgi:acetyltransferase-like isoleucine patch superfamily enzyme